MITFYMVLLLHVNDVWFLHLILELKDHRVFGTVCTSSPPGDGLSSDTFCCNHAPLGGHFSMHRHFGLKKSTCYK